MTIVGECDACGKGPRVLHHCWVTGIETYACAECHGEPVDSFDDELDETPVDVVR